MKEFQKIGHIIYGLSLPVTVNYVFNVFLGQMY